MKLKRTQISITQEQYRRLVELTQDGTSLAEHIRRAINDYLARPKPDGRD